ENRRLMAHELTHVVQQTKRAPAQAQRMEVAQEAEEPAVQRGWVADKAESVARNVPGYTVLTVILGKSPITGDRVSRTAENLVGGFLGLIPGGTVIFDKLKESRALDKAFDWVSTRLSELNITWSRIKGLVSDFIDEQPSWSPLDDAKRIFKPLVNDVITFVVEIKDKILEFIVRGALALAGPFGEKVWGVIEKARDTISMILNDPLGFAKNLVGAIVKGFKQFGDNIWKHLKAGLMGWLFGTLQGMDITLPEKLDFKGIMSVVLQILGLTYANFRKLLVKKLGKNGEKKVAFIEKSIEVVKILLKEGFVGIWQRLIEMMENFKQTVIDGIRDFVINTIVMGAISWVAGLSNPVGAVVKVCLSIYNMIVTFLERLDQILEVANSIFSSIGAIAKGQVKQAADFIEKTIAATIPVFLAFVAALIPVTGITKSIKKVIDRLQASVKKAIDKMLTFLVKKAKKLFSKNVGKVNAKRKLPKSGFMLGEEPHELVPKKKGPKFELQIASDNPRHSDKVQAELEAEAARAKEFGDDAKCMDLFEKAFKTEVNEAEDAVEAVKPAQQKNSTKKTGDKAQKEVEDAAKKLNENGPCIADNPFFEDKPQDGAIIRAREPRIPEIEGVAGLYRDRGKDTKQTIAKYVGEGFLGARGEQKLSNYYENDHAPEKSMAFAVADFVKKEIKPKLADGLRDGATALPDPPLGDIAERNLGTKGEALPAMTIYRPIHRDKPVTGGKDHKKMIAKAAEAATPAEQVGALQTGIAEQFKAELDAVAAQYDADENASPEIRGKVNAGMETLSSLNKELYGFDPQSPPRIDTSKGKDGAGSDLLMEGTPNFVDLEGEYKAYGSKPGDVGKYLEYDHVVEKALANKARDMTVGDPKLVEAVAPLVEGKLAEQNLPPEEAAAKQAEADKRLGKAYKRVLFAGKKMRKYDQDAAGTVALYRPVHREITAAHKMPSDLLSSVSEAATLMADYAVSDPIDEAKYKAALVPLHTEISTAFDGSMTKHIDLINQAYQVEMKEFAALNTSKEAATKMAGVINRVGASLKTLRAESTALFQ
ncbi:MAG: hypothetical protein AAF401_03140, partial [Pseudomonadota bacterium]